MEKKFKIEYKFQRDNGIVCHIESETVKIKNQGNELENFRLASIKAMRGLLSISQDIVTGKQRLIEYNIIWEK